MEDIKKLEYVRKEVAELLASNKKAMDALKKDMDSLVHCIDEIDDLIEVEKLAKKNSIFDHHGMDPLY